MHNFKAKLFLFAGGITLSVAAIFFLYFEISATAESVRDIKASAAIGNKIAENISRLDQDYSRVSVDLVKIDKFLPSADQVMLLSEKLERLAKNFNLEARWNFNADFGASQSDLPPSSVFEAVVNGKLQDFLRYGDAIQNLGYFLKFTNITITSDGNVLRDAVAARLNGVLYVSDK